MAYVPTLKTQYKEQIVPALMKEFGYSSVMQCPKLTKIVINQGMGQAVAYRCGHLALLPDNFFCKIKKFVDLKLLEMLSCW